MMQMDNAICLEPGGPGFDYPLNQPDEFSNLSKSDEKLYDICMSNEIRLTPSPELEKSMQEFEALLLNKELQPFDPDDDGDSIEFNLNTEDQEMLVSDNEPELSLGPEYDTSIAQAQQMLDDLLSPNPGFLNELTYDDNIGNYTDIRKKFSSMKKQICECLKLCGPNGT